VIITAFWIWPANSSAQTTLLVLDSQPGDYIGGGVLQTYSEADGTFNAARNFDGGVTVAFATPDHSHRWSLDFAAADDLPLGPGVYEGAVRYPFQGPGQPGLSVSGDGRGCNTLTGRFEVLEVTYGPTGGVVSFAADFEQHCEGLTPALFGSVHFNSGAPVPPTLTLTLTGCTHCSAGALFAVEARLTNPGDRNVPVEFKVGFRLPDGTPVNLFGPTGEHLAVTLPAGLDVTFPMAGFQWPDGAPSGIWRFEGALLEAALGKTYDRKVRTFEVEP
jgi:hypothetical protein